MTELTENQRTRQQNKALHKYFTMLAETLNDAGYDMKRTLKENVDIPWKPDTVKDFLWRPIQEAAVQKESTTELTTKEIDEVLNVLDRYLGEKLGIHVEFPSIEVELREKQANERKFT